MADVHDSKTRSKNMRAIGPKDTKPERVVEDYLRQAGLPFDQHVAQLPGKPDFVLRDHSAVVFVHGCYWHRHPRCRYTTEPKTNVKFWMEKLEGNRKRDRRHRAALKKQGWHVFVIWECQVKNQKHLEKLLKALRATA